MTFSPSWDWIGGCQVWQVCSLHFILKDQIDSRINRSRIRIFFSVFLMSYRHTEHFVILSEFKEVPNHQFLKKTRSLPVFVYDASNLLTDLVDPYLVRLRLVVATLRFEIPPLLQTLVVFFFALTIQLPFTN